MDKTTPRVLELTTADGRPVLVNFNHVQGVEDADIAHDPEYQNLRLKGARLTLRAKEARRNGNHT